MMRIGSVIGISLALLFVAAAMMSCSTKGINFEAGLKKFEARQFAEAIVVFQEIAKTESKYTNRARFYVGECLKFQAKWDEATAQFQTVADSEPMTSYLGIEAKNRVAQIREGRRDIERLKILHDNNPGNYDVAADALLEWGSVYDNKLGHYEQAIKTYQQLIAEFPGTPKAAQAQYSIGSIYFYKLYDLDKGWKAFLEINETNYPEMKFRVAEVQDLLRETNKVREEIIEHMTFIKQSQKRKIPEFGRVSGYEIYGVKQDQVAQSFLAIGQKWKQLKDYPKAIEAYRILIERLPLMLRQAAQARFAIAEIYQLDLNRYYEAVDAYEEYIKFHPTDYRRDEAIYGIALCYETLRDYEMAYEYYRTYRDTYKEPPGKFYKPAELKVRQYEYDEDQDGYPYYKEVAAGTSDTDPGAHP